MTDSRRIIKFNRGSYIHDGSESANSLTAATSTSSSWTPAVTCVSGCASILEDGFSDSASVNNVGTSSVITSSCNDVAGAESFCNLSASCSSFVVIVVVLVDSSTISCFFSSSFATSIPSLLVSSSSLSFDTFSSFLVVLFPSVIFCNLCNSSISFEKWILDPSFAFVLGNKSLQFPHSAHCHDVDLAASRFRSVEDQSKAPMAPSAGVGRKLIKASKMSRIPHAGCQSSG